jgi:hypothetical protein
VHVTLYVYCYENIQLSSHQLEFDENRQNKNCLQLSF